MMPAPWMTDQRAESVAAAGMLVLHVDAAGRVPIGIPKSGYIIIGKGRF